MAKETGTFGAAVLAYVKAANVALKNETSANNEACRVVAIGFLGRMEKGAINEAVKTAGAYGDEPWKSVKVALSRAWRSVGGEYGFGDILAEKWAGGDFEISLGEAYKASAPPKAVRDVKAEVIALLLTLNEADRAEVIEAVSAEKVKVEEHMQKRSEAFAKLFKQNAAVVV